MPQRAMRRRAARRAGSASNLRRAVTLEIGERRILSIASRLASLHPSLVRPERAVFRAASSISALAPLLPCRRGMTAGPGTHAPARREPGESATVLRATFVRGMRALTCDVRVTERRACDLCLIPHWAVASYVVERYEHPGDAFQRYADITRSFREAGWIVLRDSGVRGTSHAA